MCYISGNGQNCPQRKKHVHKELICLISCRWEDLIFVMVKK